MHPWMLCLYVGVMALVIFLVFRKWGRSEKTDEFVRVHPLEEQPLAKYLEGEDNDEES